MRKASREIKDFDKIVKILDGCDTIHVALHDEPFPYVLPLSFGYDVIDGKIHLYFHGAKEGKKLDLIAKNNKVCVCAEVLHSYVDLGYSVTADYESIIGMGHAKLLTGDAAVHGLQMLLDHCKTGNYSAKDCIMKGITAVVEIVLDEVTGKARYPEKLS